MKPTRQMSYAYLRLKTEIKWRILKNQKWRNYGLQLSICYPGHEQKLLNKMLDLKGRLLLLDIYDLIFNLHHPYHLVFKCVRELLTEFELMEDFNEWINDPLIMIVHCLEENAKQEAKESFV